MDVSPSLPPSLLLLPWVEVESGVMANLWAGQRGRKERGEEEELQVERVVPLSKRWVLQVYLSLAGNKVAFGWLPASSYLQRKSRWQSRYFGAPGLCCHFLGSKTTWQHWDISQFMKHFAWKFTVAHAGAKDKSALSLDFIVREGEREQENSLWMQKCIKVQKSNMKETSHFFLGI